MKLTPVKKPPNLVAMFLEWLLIGAQSFGGGSSTFSLVHQAAIQRAWMSEDEFVRAWALVQVSPGINLVKLTVLIGYHLAGWPGILAAVAGLLLPSAVVTVLMTAGFAVLNVIPWVHAVMKGVIPAAIGLSFAMAVQMTQPVLSGARRDGPARLGAHLITLAAAALLMVFTRLSPLLIFGMSGFLAVLLFWLTPVRQQAVSPGRQP